MVPRPVKSVGWGYGGGTKFVVLYTGPSKNFEGLTREKKIQMEDVEKS